MVNTYPKRPAQWAIENAVDLGDLAQSVTRYRFENWLDQEAEAVRQLVAAGLQHEGFIKP